MNVGSLRAILRLDNDQFNKGVDQSEAKFKRARKGIGVAAKAMAGAVVGVGGAMLGAAAATAKHGQAVADNARRAGVSTKNYQEMKYALEGAGLETSRVNQLLQRNTQRLGRAADGNEKYADAYKQLGVDIHDASGELRSSEDVMDDVLESLAGIEDPALRASRAGDLLGTKAGRELAGALDEGVDSIEDARKEAQELGLVLDQDTIDASERFGDSWDLVKDQMMGLVHTVGAPVMGFLADELFPAITKYVIPALQGFAEWIGPRLSAGASAAADVFQQNVMPAVDAVAGFVTGHVVPAVQELVGWLVDEAAPALREWAGRLVDAYHRSEAFRDIVVGAFRAVKNVVGPVLGWLGGRLKDVGDWFGLTRTTVHDEAAAMSNEAVGHVSEMAGGIIDEVGRLNARAEPLTEELYDTLAGKVDEIRQEVVDDSRDMRNRYIANITAMAEQSGTISKAKADELIGQAQREHAGTVEEANRRRDEVIRVMQAMRDDASSVTDQQRQLVVDHVQSQREQAVDQLASQRSEANAVMNRLRAEQGEISRQMAAEVIRDAARQRRETVKAAEDEYRDKVAEFTRMATDLPGFTEQMARDAIQDARRQRDETVTAAWEQQVGVVGNVRDMRQQVGEETDLMTGQTLSGFERMRRAAGRWNIRVLEYLSSNAAGQARFIESTRETAVSWGVQLADMVTRAGQWNADTIAFIAGVGGRIKSFRDSAITVMRNFATQWAAIWSSAVGTARNRVSSIVSAVGSGIQKVIDIINKFIGGFNKIASAVGVSLQIDTIPPVNPKPGHPAMHSGGIIGEDGQRHDGRLRSNEQQIIGQRGEEVLTEKDPRHRKNLGLLGRMPPNLQEELQASENSQFTYRNLLQNRNLFINDRGAPGWSVGQAAAMWDRLSPHINVQTGIGREQGLEPEKDYNQASAVTYDKPEGDYLGYMNRFSIMLNEGKDRSAHERLLTAAHEIGHVLGFGHPNAHSIMADTPGWGSKSASGITSWDRNMLRRMYPPPAGAEDGGEDEGGPGVIARTVQSITDWISDKLGGAVSGTIGQLQDLARGNPLVGLMANAGIRFAREAIPFLSSNATQDPTDGGGGGPGGKMLARVKAILERFPSARITSAYRTPAENRAAGGVPDSFHLDKNNPAVDIGGPASVLDRIAGILREQGGLRELLWRVAGHFDHLHVAHDGGQVVNGGMRPLGSDVLARLSDDETVIPPGKMPAGGDGGDLAGLMREQNRLLRQGQAILVDREVLGELVRGEFHRLDRDNITAGVP